MANGEVERIICATLRHEPSYWQDGVDPALLPQFLEAGRQHGVLPLLGAELRGSDFQAAPSHIREACQEAARAQAMHELAHRAEIIRVLDALVTAGVKPLLLKGTPLAYSHYPNAALRPRADTDMLVPPDQRDEAGRTLERLGYAKSTGGMEGRFISYQATWSRPNHAGNFHHLDLHWRTNNSQLLLKVLGYDELAQRANSLPVLGPSARAPAPVHALLFACVHRAGHINSPYYVDGVPQRGSDRLIWLYDIDLLVRAMGAPELDEFVALAVAKRVRAICHDALLRARECFATPVPPHVIAGLAPGGHAEASSHYLRGNRMRLMAEDLRALDRWTDRIGWLKELAFPPAAYMRGKYPAALIPWLPALYVRRGLAGVSRLFGRRETGDGH